MLAGSNPHRAQRLGRIAALDALDVAILVAHPHAGAGLDQDPLAAGVDQQQVQAAEQPAALIGLGQARPERSRDDAEEAAGIGPEPAGADDADADVAGVDARLARGGDGEQRLGHRPPMEHRAGSALDATSLEVPMVQAGGRVPLPAVLAADAGVAVADLGRARAAGS